MHTLKFYPKNCMTNSMHSREICFLYSSPPPPPSHAAWQTSFETEDSFENSFHMARRCASQKEEGVKGFVQALQCV